MSLSNSRKVSQFNKYKMKRRSITRLYFGSFVFSFVSIGIVELIQAIFHASGESDFFQLLYAITAMPGGIALVVTIPYIAYVFYLTNRSRIYEKGLENTIEDIKYEGLEKSSVGPWVYVFILLFILPPAGLFVLVRKAFTEPAHYLGNALVLESSGISVGALGLILLALHVKIFMGVSYIPVMIYYTASLPFVCGASMYAVGKIIHRRGREIARCQNLIWVDAVLDLNELAEMIGLNYMQTVRKVQEYIDDGFLFSCFIDYKEKRIVCPQEFPKVAIKCRKCGGTTVKLKGIAAVCSFCGRII